MKSPFNIVKDKFGSKEKLVEAVQSFAEGDLWLARTNESKGLAHVSNAKLLRLHETFSTVKEKFGTRAKLIDAILDLEKRTKDEGYKSRLLKFPVPRLYDMYRSVSKRHAKANAPAEATAPAKKAAAKPAEKAAKKSAAKTVAATSKAKKSAAPKKKTSSKKG